MRLLFNKAENGAEELRKLTGSYYANNEFDRIETEILLESENLINLVGEAVYSRAENHYYSARYLVDDATAEEKLNDNLVQHLQLPVALFAAHNYYQANLVSHEDSGRKVKLDDQSEKMAWEWMLDRDDEANIRKANKTQDRLIRFLDKQDLEEWKNSDQRKASRELFINSTTAFNDIYPIDNSPRFYYSSLAFNREVQREIIRKALGAKYDDVLQYFQDPPAHEDEQLEKLLSLTKLAIPINVMVLAAKRFPLQVLPEGVVQQFKSMVQSRSSSQPATMDLLRQFTLHLEKDAKEAIDNLKKEVKSLDPTANQYQYLPNNSPDNKFCRT